MGMALSRGLLLLLLLHMGTAALAKDVGSGPRVYVILWFDTEDYLLPASDDAALHLARFLSQEGVRATFKVVGEKARRLEKRGRSDVIEALKKHEIGYHSHWHSVQPSPAMYQSHLGWDEGVAEFDRREGPGRDAVERIFGVAPSCYGQPGSSWGPQSYGAMRKWGMPVYLDAGSHVNLDEKPCYYCGILNLYHLRYTLRADLNDPAKLEQAQAHFLEARKQLLSDGGGIVSIYYHPCEFVHKEFWDGVNFSKGANPPPEAWKAPPAKTAEQTQSCYRVFEEYIRFIKRFPEVRFITARDAAKLYADHALEREWGSDHLKELAAHVGKDVSYYREGDTTLSAAEIFQLLNDVVAGQARDAGDKRFKLKRSPLGPTGRLPLLTTAVTTDASQLTRTSKDVADYLRKHGRIPTACWLGSTPVPPDAYLRTLSEMVPRVLEDRELPAQVEVRPAAFAAARYVAEDNPSLWGWVIFPPRFKAPAMMGLARQQAWTLKPALPGRESP